jgi:hypothetical protein
MKPTRLILLVVIMMLAIASRQTALAGSLTDLDAKYGFRDLVFGSTLTKDMKLTEDDGDEKWYNRPHDDLKIGAAVLKEISYGFYQNQLMSVLIHTTGFVNSRALLQVLTEAYGQGTQDNKFSEDYWWRGNRVRLVYRQNPITDDATIIFTSYELSAKQKADEKAKAKKAAEGL